MNVLVIDVGTSSMRALLSGARGERLLGHQVAYHPTYLPDGRVEQDASSFASALCEVVGSVARNAGEKGHAVDLVTMTSQRSSIVPVDDADEPLMPFIMWQDTRNAALCDELSKSGEHIFSLSGTRVNTVFSGGKMAWVERELPEVASRCRRYANVPEYLMHLMTGSWHTDPTYASRSNLMNIRTRDWDPELLGLFGVSRDKLSDIVECGQIVGTVSSFFSSATGLAAGTPVVSSGGDQQCAAVGQGVASPGTVSVVTGTGAFLETAAPSVPDDLTSDVICNASCLPGQYTLEASVLSCCSAFDWFRATFCPDMDYARIGRELEVQHARGTSCVVLPYFQGRGTPDWNAQATATLHGIRLSATREELLYALLVGIFTEVRNNLDSMERYVPLVRGSVSGGLTQTPVSSTRSRRTSTAFPSPVLMTSSPRRAARFWWPFSPRGRTGRQKRHTVRSQAMRPPRRTSQIPPATASSSTSSVASRTSTRDSTPRGQCTKRDVPEACKFLHTSGTSLFVQPPRPLVNLSRFALFASP